LSLFYLVPLLFLLNLLFVRNESNLLGSEGFVN
jgi:hypothetical protein